MKKVVFAIALATAFAAAAGGLGTSAGAQAATGARAAVDAQPEAVFVAVAGALDPDAVRRFEKRLREAVERRPRYVVIELDARGDDVESARDMAVSVARVPPGVKTLAYIADEAVGAAALVALACDEIALAPGARLGDLGTPPAAALQAELRTLAAHRRYPADLVEALGSGRLTLDPEEARKRGLATIFPADRVTLVRALEDRSGAPLAIVEARGGSGEVERLLGLAARNGLLPFFLLLGLLGLAVELWHPGLVFPGALGLLCLAIGLSGGHLTGVTDTLDLGLIAAGVVLILIEMFVLPGFGVTGVAGILLLLAGLFLANVETPWPRTAAQSAEWGANIRRFGLGLAGTGAVFALICRLLPASPLLRGLVHQGTQRIEDGYTVASSARVAVLGQPGMAATDLRPAGKVVIADEVLDAVSDGGWIDRGSAVEVVETSENRLVVKKKV